MSSPRPGMKYQVIFVNVAAYRDPEVVTTIADLFRKARHPDQIDVAVVSQTLASDGITIDDPRVRVVHLDAAQARGPCYARALGYREWSGQLYALQIDSHMRFAPDWDARMLDQLALCASPKSLLTTYPEGYVPPGTLLGDRPAFLAAKQFDGRGALILQGRVEPPPARPRPTAFIAAGFLFGGSDWIREVPYDPHLYFHGEEATLAARLWTRGWDFFGPIECLLWHQYQRRGRLHWEDARDWHEVDRSSMARVRQLLRMEPLPGDTWSDLRGFDLGMTRSFGRYQRMAGVNFRARTIAPHALAGNLARP
jgi:glycosyltransferase involved in cell wall biosynthesis